MDQNQVPSAPQPQDAKSAFGGASKLTGLKKRQQIQVAGRVMFIWVAIAACALSFCAATGQYLFTKWQHNNAVMAAKQKASDQLTKNLTNVQELVKEVDALVADTGLASVKTDEEDPNTKSVLDALPITFDPAALATSLQQVVLASSGLSIESITVPQEVEATSEEAMQATPQEVPFSFIVSGSYEGIKKALVDIERTIRPIKVTGINLTGTDNNLRATVEAVTYYQPTKTVKLGEVIIK